MVRHHLLLPITATRGDLNDPKTIEAVSETLGGDPQLLELLHALAEADSKATGPGVWSDWKASLVADLVRRCRMMMAGEPLPKAEPTTPHYLSLAADHGVHVEIKPGDSERIDVVMVAPDERGVVSKAAAVLALNSLRIHSASVNLPRGRRDHRVRGVTTFRFAARSRACCVSSSWVPSMATSMSSARWRSATATLSVAATARAGEVQVGVPVTRSTAPPRILWLDTATSGELVLEVRAMDRSGLLALLARALERAGADIEWAKVNTFGSTAADVFCVQVPSESNGNPDKVARAAVEEHLLAVLGASRDAVVDEPVGD